MHRCSGVRYVNYFQRIAQEGCDISIISRYKNRGRVIEQSAAGTIDEGTCVNWCRRVRYIYDLQGVTTDVGDIGIVAGNKNRIRVINSCSPASVRENTLTKWRRSVCYVNYFQCKVTNNVCVITGDKD